VGRVTAAGSNTVSVFVDDHAVAVGTTSALAGDTNRTWYDGISYAAVTPFQLSITNVVYRAASNAVTLAWNSIPPESLLLPPSFTVQKKDLLSDAAWRTVAANVMSSGNPAAFTDLAATNGSAFYRITLP
jgi:hypothetical protein